jgi:Uma2 family endonuclease
MSQAYENTAYTYADFLEWNEDERCELLDGEIVMMAPPARVHQDISRNLFLQISDYLKGKPCKAYYAPFSVRLNPAADLSDDTVFEPDIVVVCDPSKLDKRGCNGAPDLIIEIISPSTARYDRLVKFHRYQKAGVREYWIVDPETKSVQVCLLDPDKNPGSYLVYMYSDTDTVSVQVLAGCKIDLNGVFGEVG